MILRKFLYLDDDLVREFLAQLEDGIYEEEELSASSSSSRSLEGGLKAGPLTGGGERGTEAAEQTNRVVRQTPQSRFQRLYAALESLDGIQPLDAIDSEIWGQLANGEIIEANVTLTPTVLDKLGEMAAAMEGLLAVGEAFGQNLDESGESAGVLQAMRALGESDSVSLIAPLIGSPEFKLGCSAPLKYVTGGDRGFLEGEATMLAKVWRKLAPGETRMLGQFASFEGFLPEADRGGFADLFAAPELQSLGGASPVLAAPGAIVTPIAIYR